MTVQLRRAVLLLGLALFSVSAVRATEAPPAAGKATITVTAIGKKESAPPSVNKDDVQLTAGKERKQVAEWAKADSLALAILIDDALDTSVGIQMNDLKSFIMAQPASTSIAVAYAANNTAMVAQDFTSDHALAAKALRLPRGISTASSPYLAVIDLVKRWPNTGGRRSVLLISSGIDYFRGSFGPYYPDVDTAVTNAQRSNVNLWSIYSPTVGHRSQSFFLANMGQNNLSKMTDDLGTTAPVAFKPYLDELQMHLNNQYLLTFAGDGGAKGKFVRVQLKTELPELEFSHAANAYIAPSK